LEFHPAALEAHVNTLSKIALLALLAVATAVALIFIAPALPVPVLWTEAEAQRSTAAQVAVAVLVVCFVGLFALRWPWTAELSAMRPARIGALALVLSVVAAGCGWLAFGALAWNALDILPRRSAEGMDEGAAVAVASVWFAALTAITARMLWVGSRDGALSAVLRKPLADAGLRRVTGVVELVPDAPRLIDPVTLRPSVAWLLDLEVTTLREEIIDKSDPSISSARFERKTHSSAKVRNGVARCVTPFVIRAGTSIVFVNDPKVRVFHRGKAVWEEGDPPAPPLPADIEADLKSRDLYDGRFGSRSIGPGDVVTAVGLVVPGDDGVFDLRSAHSVTPKFWASPLHGVRGYVERASRRAAKAVLAE
jgi:hypothetical protein